MHKWLLNGRAFFLAGFTIALASCTTAIPESNSTVIERDLKFAIADVRDMRAEFRNIFCSRLTIEVNCSNILLHLPDEPIEDNYRLQSDVNSGAASMLPARYRLAFVPGLFAGCIVPTILPFIDVVDKLRSDGFDARILSVEARASSEHNGDLIAQQLLTANPDPRPWIIFGYSKGLPDILEALIRNPTMGRNIAAVVSYAGAVGGSMLADDTSNVAAHLLDYVPLPGCDIGDGSSIHSLRRDVRKLWWKVNHKRLNVQFFSLVATAQPHRVSLPLRNSFAKLSKFAPQNDGQLVAEDAIVPGGALLGFINADHWAMAMPLSKQLPIAGAMFIDDLPRADLVMASIQVISLHTSHK